jgi:hypothetical protein
MYRRRSRLNFQYVTTYARNQLENPIIIQQTNHHLTYQQMDTKNQIRTNTQIYPLKSIIQSFISIFYQYDY